jgi:hypothetical protein
VQRIGDDMIITEILLTDKLGDISLRGYFCMPLYVAIGGAILPIKHGGDLPTIRQVVPLHGGTSAIAAFGTLNPNYLGYTERHRDCG